MVVSYTLVLSKGTHVVSSDQARRILDAVTNGEPFVEVQIGVFGDATETRRVTVIVSHVVAIFENEARDDEIELPPEKVRYLRRGSGR